MTAETVVLGTASTRAGGAPASDLGEATELVTGLHASFRLRESLAFRGEPDQVVRQLT
jgi:hypothetical protein